jgi:hypothetical protein
MERHRDLYHDGIPAIARRTMVKPAPRYDALTGDGDLQAPTVIHQSVATARAGQPLAIPAQVRDPSGVKWVRLRYRSVNLQDSYRTEPMLLTGEEDLYQAVIPAEYILPAWDLMYLIEVMDHRGNGQIHPDLNQETPYVVVRIAGKQ